MKILDNAARRMLFWGALLLMGWAGYEFSIRWDTIGKASYTVFSMAADGGFSLIDVLFRYKYIDALAVPLFLLVCFLFGLVVFALRARLIMGVLFLPLSILLAWYSVDAHVFFSKNLWHMLKMLPMLLIATGSAINLISAFYIRQNKKKHAAQAAAPNAHVRKFHPPS
ncbi:MAG: hypothetical protein GX916_00225 [Clostridiales bacterium]|nr:hypothetical protein [Clostridiales bacterium]